MNIFRIAGSLLLFTMIQMKSNFLWLLILLLGVWGCSPDNTDPTSLVLDSLTQEQELDKGKQEEDVRFVSKDRNLENILSDFDKPLKTFPTIWQNQAVTQKNGRLYREDILDEPFTGSVTEEFPDGSISLQTSYYKGLPHGQQVRNFPNGQKALEANFDQGVLVGVKSRWWPNGLIREEAYWSEGKYIGRRLWDRTGRLVKEEIVPQE